MLGIDGFGMLGSWAMRFGTQGSGTWASRRGWRLALLFGVRPASIQGRSSKANGTGASMPALSLLQLSQSNPKP